MISLKSLALSAGLIVVSFIPAHAQSGLLPRLDPLAIERSTEAPQLVWQRKGRSNVCVTRAGNCTFSDGGSRPIGTACICRSRPGIKGRTGG